MTMPRPDTPSPQPLSRKQERGSSTRESDSDRFLLRADWDAAPGVHAFTTLRSGAGRPQPPFDTFNLGTARESDGDAPAGVEGQTREAAGCGKRGEGRVVQGWG